MSYQSRVVITGVGLTSPLGNDLFTLRSGLLEGKCGLRIEPVRYMGDQVLGFCDFPETKYQSKKAHRRGTRAGSIAVFCAQEALRNAISDFDEKWNQQIDKSRVGVYLGITEHGNVETEEEVYQLGLNKGDLKLWSHHHNPRTVANSPAGEVTLNLGITGPHYTLGAACAGGNAGLIQGLQMLLLGEVDMAIAGGVSESPRSFGIFAGFQAQGALAIAEFPDQAIKPLDKNRSGTVISEGGCIYVLERLDDALARGANILGEIVGHGMNSDAVDYVNPHTERQMECMQLALKRAGLNMEEIDIVSMHATGTGLGDQSEALAIRNLTLGCSKTYINFSKGHLGHAMGAAGALELAGNLPSFEDHLVHPGIGVSELDPECAIENLIIKNPLKVGSISTILNNSFGMLGINSCIIVKKYREDA